MTHDENMSQVILPTQEIFDELLMGVSSVMSDNLLQELMSDACSSLYYESEPTAIISYSEQLFERNFARIFEESNNRAFANDSASRISSAWYKFTFQLRQLYYSYNLYVDGSAVYHYQGEVDGDIILQHFDD